MGYIKQVNIKNCPHYFFIDMTNIKIFDLNVLSIDQVSFKNNADCVIYDTEYFKNLNSKNSLYFVFNNVDVYIKEYKKNKYLIFASTNKNKEVLKNYAELWDAIKDSN